MTSTALPLLTILGVIPLVGALVVMFVGERLARVLALAFSLVTLAGALYMAAIFDRGAPEQFQFAEVHSWIPQFGVSYALGADGMTLAMIVMAAILVPVCIVAAWHDTPMVGGRHHRGYFAWMLVLETMMIGVFAATDVFLFYVFFEAMLIPVYFLINNYGGANRSAAALKFLLFSLAGGLIMLVAVIAVYVFGPGGAQGFLITNLTGLALNPIAENLLFLGFFIAFAVKAPMWPVHTWLPDAATAARPATAVLLVGVLDKVGTYGMIRFCLQMFPNASQWATPVVIVLALISIIYGAVLAIGSRDMMRLIAYTSVSHFGYIVLGIFAMTSVGMTGSVLYMVNHGFSTAALFLIAGMLVARHGSKDVRDYGGWQRVTPVLAGTFLVAGMSGLALPGLGSFVSEFLVMMGTFQRYPIAAVISSVGIILAATYILLLYMRVFTGPAPGSRLVEVDGAVSYDDGDPHGHTDHAPEATASTTATDGGAHAAQSGEWPRPLVPRPRVCPSLTSTAGRSSSWHRSSCCSCCSGSTPSRFSTSSIPPSPGRSPTWASPTPPPPPGP
ncbi:NADH-quinone oxidoreductase subunit M [Mobilicoccus caccae]|uniref:NADH-quinone oxidoreductase subunit M n=1 Tax=Mobilicoccus caccae TaxID=1859295 RepID=A0ABQ6IRR3_9MICO|nr:NADH-quinone oxidoreductase subunit M [Mobilicoccus caccae]GMA40628.1 NADH-quinone oxidoreductase subunit M [Mobilicoccus caccae]